jgi:hypothetical protein
MRPHDKRVQGIASDTSPLKMIARFNYLGGLVRDWGGGPVVSCM